MFLRKKKKRCFIYTELHLDKKATAALILGLVINVRKETFQRRGKNLVTMLLDVLAMFFLPSLKYGLRVRYNFQYYQINN